MDDYERTLAQSCVPVGLAVNHAIACVTQMMCHPDEQMALDRGLEGGNFFGYSLGHYYVFGEHRPGSTDVWTEFLERRGSAGILSRGRGRAAPGAPGRQAGGRGPDGTAGRDRHAG